MRYFLLIGSLLIFKTSLFSQDKLLDLAYQLAVPENVNASDGKYEDRIRVYWNEIDATSRFKIYRSTTDNLAKAKELFLTKEKALRRNGMYDRNVNSGILYYYWVKNYASDTLQSNFSRADSGFVPERKSIVTPEPLPKFINTPNTSEIELVWSVVNQIERYQIHIAPKETTWNTLNGFTALQQITVDTIVESNRFTYTTTDNIIDEYNWSVRAISVEDTSYFSEERTILSIDNKQVFGNALRNQVDIDVNEIITESSITTIKMTISSDIALSFLVFASEDTIFDANDILLSRVNAFNLTTDVSFSFAQSNKPYLWIIPKKETLLLLDSQILVENN